MRLIHLVAFDEAGAIGKDNSLLWRIPEDLQQFKEHTMGQSLLVGRKTYEGMPKLKGRLTTVASRTNDLEYWIGKAKLNALQLNQDTVFVIGGAEVYKATQHLVDEVWFTHVHETFAEADTFYDLAWLHTHTDVYWTGEPNLVTNEGLGYQFYKAKRVKEGVTVL